MQNPTLRLLLLLGLVGGASASAPSTTSAQDIDPEAGGVYIPPAQTETPPPPPADTGSPPSRAWYEGGPTGHVHAESEATDAEAPPDGERTSATSGAAGPADGRSDHARMVGRMAVGYMGLTVVPIGTPNGAFLVQDTVSAPALGVRYWFSELVGIDVGIGFGFLGGNAETGTMSVPVDNSFAFTIHGGLPLTLFHETHYKFLIIPEINLGVASGTAFGASQDQDRGREGLLVQIGGRIGTEIHFGFMDIPQLSLQASVGLYFDYRTASVGNNRAGSAQDVGLSSYGFATTVLGEPWDILLGSLNAMYYF